jgi:LacI family transcriptional regulator
MPATIRDVAERAGVSIATVSRVLSGRPGSRPGTVAAVTEAARMLDYHPSGVARSLKLRTTRTIGLIVTDIENPYFPQLVRAIEDAALRRGLAILLGNGAEDPEREASYLELLVERRVDGIIVASTRITERHGRWLARSRVPAILVNCEVPGSELPAILSDNQAGGRLAAEHLLGLGHRLIGHVTAPIENAAAPERLAGICDALLAVGLDCSSVLRVAEGDGHVSGGERAAGQLLDASRPTAIACYNDLSAIGAMRAARARGLRVPQDVSIVGFDGIELADYVEPPLTTVVQQVGAMGRWAVDALAKRIGPDIGEQPPPAGVVRLPVELRIGGTTGPPARA